MAALATDLPIVIVVGIYGGMTNLATRDGATLT
jgi:hypothetical protein